MNNRIDMLKVSDIVTDLQGYTSNISNSNWDISDVYRYLKDFILETRRENALPWTKKSTQLPLFVNVVEYELPSDLSDLIKPQKNYPNKDDGFFKYMTQDELARNIGLWNKLALDFKNSTQILAARINSGDETLVDALNDSSAWTESGDITEAVDDPVFFLSNNGSIKLTIVNSSGSCALINSSVSIDLTSYIDSGTWFLDLQAGAQLSSVEIEYGDTSGHWINTITKQYCGAAFEEDWNTLGANWQDAIKVGNPSTIQYITIRINGAQSGVYRLNGLYLRLPDVYKLPYYSIYNFRDTLGALKEYADSQDDVFLGPDEWAKMGEAYVTKKIATYQVKDKDLASEAQKEYVLAFNTLKTKFPELVPKIQTCYYDVSSSSIKRSGEVIIRNTSDL